MAKDSKKKTSWNLDFVRSFFSAITSPFKGIVHELKNTSWTNRKELVNLVLYTVLTCGIISLLILGIDIFLIKIRDIILK